MSQQVGEVLPRKSVACWWLAAVVPVWQPHTTYLLEEPCLRSKFSSGVSLSVLHYRLSQLHCWPPGHPGYCFQTRRHTPSPQPLRRLRSSFGRLRLVHSVDFWLSHSSVYSVGLGRRNLKLGRHSSFRSSVLAQSDWLRFDFPRCLATAKTWLKLHS